MRITNLLERAGALEVISYLYKRKHATKTELIDRASVCQQSVCRRIDELVRAGLVTVKREDGFPGRKIHTLTPEGMELASTPLGSISIEWNLI